MPGNHEPETLQALVASLAEHGERPALLVLREDDLETWPYDRLADQARRLAAGLAQAGVGRGDRVAVLADNRPEWIVAALAVLRAGAVVVPLDAQLGERLLRHVLEDSEPRAVFTDGRRAERLDGLEAGIPLHLLDAGEDEERSWRHLLADDSGADLPRAEPDDIAALFYTSGTTGPPKGVPLTHANLLTQFPVLRDASLVDTDDRVCLPLPLHHVYPFVMGMLQPFLFGIAIVLPRGLTGPELVRALVQSRATVLIGVPRMYDALVSGLQTRAAAAGRLPAAALRLVLALSGLLRRLGIRAGKLLLAPLHRRIAPALRLVASGGGPLSPELARRLEALGWSVGVGYGLTETSPLITLRLPGDRHHATVGRPVPGVELRIDHEAAPEGTPEDQGEVLVRGPNVFSGYRNLPDKTEEALTEDGWFRTGDLGRLEDGRLRLIGRVSELIVTEGGKNIQPDEVEETYAEHPAIREIGILQHEGRLVGLIVPETRTLREQSGREPDEVIREAVQARGRELPSYERISDFATTREALPRTRLGKLRRHRLAERYEAAAEGREEERGPQAIEEMPEEDRELLDHAAAAAVWQWLTERYPRQPLTPDASLELDLGVDSMEWLNLTMEIAERAGVQLPEDEIAEIDSVRDLLQAAAEAGEGEAPDLSEDPEAALGERDRRWLRPLGIAGRSAAGLLYWINRLAVRALFRVRVEGRERLEDAGQVLIAPNHRSALDPFLLAAVLGRRRLLGTFWGGWVGIAFANPLFRLVSRLAQAVPVDPRRGPISGLALAAAVLDRGHGLIWFPEGERSPDGQLQDLKRGVGVLLDAQPVTVVPVHLAGTREALPPGRVIPRPLRRLRVCFGEPVSAETLADEGEGDDAVARLVDGLHRRLAALEDDQEGAS